MTGNGIQARLVWLVCGLLCASTTGLAHQVATPLFDAYVEGRYDEVRASLAAPDDIGDFRKAVEREGRDWPAEAKAAFLLEAADVAMRRSDVESRYGPEVGLFKDACEVVRDRPADSAFAAVWHDVVAAMTRVTRADGYRAHPDWISTGISRKEPGGWRSRGCMSGTRGIRSSLCCRRGSDRTTRGTAKPAFAYARPSTL